MVEGALLDIPGMVLCLCVCVDGRSRYLYIVLGGYLRILGESRVQLCCTLSAFYRAFSVTDIANPYLLACGCWTWISNDIGCFYEE